MIIDWNNRKVWKNFDEIVTFMSENISCTDIASQMFGDLIQDFLYDSITKLVFNSDDYSFPEDWCNSTDTYMFIDWEQHNCVSFKTAEDASKYVNKVFILSYDVWEEKIRTLIPSYLDSTISEQLFDEWYKDYCHITEENLWEDNIFEIS